MARPVYGGWITMTAHLSLTYNLPLFKISKRSEKTKTSRPKPQIQASATIHLPVDAVGSCCSFMLLPFL